MNTITGELNKSGQQLVASVSNAAWDEVIGGSSEILWTLADLRPDFEELPGWIAKSKVSAVAQNSLDSAIEA